MKRLVIACAVLASLGAGSAAASEGCRSSCADGFTWSPEQGTCVPSPVAS